MPIKEEKTYGCDIAFVVRVDGRRIRGIEAAELEESSELERLLAACSESLAFGFLDLHELGTHLAHLQRANDPVAQRRGWAEAVAVAGDDPGLPGALRNLPYEGVRA